MAEFRQEALRMLERSDKGVSAIEQELGTTLGLLYKWQATYGQAISGEHGMVRVSVSELEAEIRRLKREYAILLEEREILKKAVKLFSQEQR